MLETKKEFIRLISSVINGSSDNCTGLNEEQAKALEKLAQRHDLAHFLGIGIKNGVITAPESISARLLNVMFFTSARMFRIDNEFKNICALLGNAKIGYMPLKGSIIKHFYPEEWMRTSCDIDILVHEEDKERAVAALCETGAFNVRKNNYHDVSVMSDSGIHIELHFSIKEHMETIDALLEKVWDYAELKNGNGYEYEMTPEFFMFHIYAHASYHFLRGGCGARTLIDIYLLERSFKYDSAELERLLKSTGILEFAVQIKKLCKIWFENGEYDGISYELEDYIFSGGTYGTQKNRISVEAKEMSGFKYILGRVWMPFSLLKVKYPILEKHKYLFPLFQIVRWVSAAFGNRRKKAANEVKTLYSIKTDEKEKINNMLNEMSLGGK